MVRILPSLGMRKDNTKSTSPRPEGSTLNAITAVILSHNYFLWKIRH